MVRLKPDGSPRERVRKGTKNSVDKALSALVEDGAITSEEKTEIVSLINYRTIIGHRVHELVTDLSTERYFRELLDWGPDRIKEFDYEAVERLQHLHRHLYRPHHYVTTLSINGPMSKAAERTFRSEIGRLKRKIGELHAVRGEDIRALNAEMSLTKTEFDNDELHPAHPLHKYDDGRLWARMQVAVYRHHFADQAAIAWSGRQTCG